jgi:HD-GYP domain-containing protein (c-di-GMP phosphodiesterase class II)
MQLFKTIESANLKPNIEKKIKDIFSTKAVDFEHRFLELTEDDLENLSKVSSLIIENMDFIMDEFYDHLLEFKETKDIILEKPGRIEQLREVHTSYFKELFSLKYDDNYLAIRFNTGLTHLNVNIPFNVFMGSYSYFLSLVIHFIKDELPKRGFSHKEILNIINSIQKIINLDITLVIRAYYSKEISEKEKLSDDFIKRLSRIAEFRDEDTGAHIERMSYYCMTIARHLGFDHDFQMDILEASPMHDIGKISIPDHILLKPAKLTDDEFEIMKTHTVKGYEILSDSDSKIMELGAEIALSHHERYDGYGYPDGLKGKNIPIVGRICIISDVFDALTNKRIYKPAYSVEESINIMKNEMGVGKYFDPLVFNAFIKGFDDIMTIKNRYKGSTSLI